MALPIFQTTDRTLTLLQTGWAALLNPFLSKPQFQSNILPNVKITTGVNVIPHLLSRKQQGWQITDINAAITLYRSADFNDLTLTLTASGPATISLEVF